MVILYILNVQMFVYYYTSLSESYMHSISVFFLLSFSFSVTQEFTTKPIPQKVLYETNVVFNCVSQGRPAPSIEWAVDLDTIDNLVVIDESLKHKYDLLQNGSLLVKAATLDEQGRYYCFSKSPGLTRNVSSTLSVYGMLCKNIVRGVIIVA